MADEEQKKAEDKAEIIMLNEENQKLKERITFLEDQVIALKKCFTGLKSVCEGAETRLDMVLQGGE